MSTPVAADAYLASTYRAMRNPAYPGELRSRSWKLIIPTKDDDPVWFKRARDYWLRQEQVYGFKIHDNITNVVDNDELVITTFAVVERVLPGPRSLSLSAQ